MAQEHRELSTAGVWWLPYGMALAGSCEAIAEEADKLLAISTTADHVLPTNAGHQVPFWGAGACRNCRMLSKTRLLHLSWPASAAVSTPPRHGTQSTSGHFRRPQMSTML